jgi:hypothetical protein
MQPIRNGAPHIKLGKSDGGWPILSELGTYNEGTDTKRFMV